MSNDPTPLIPLNVFQRLARSWEKIHPYNAAQAIRLRGRLDDDGGGETAARLARAWADAIATTRLGRVRVSGRAYRHEVLDGEMAAYLPRLLPPGTDLAGYLSAELNRPFDDPAEPPFRPFLLPGDSGDDSFYLGLVYQHWVADSAAIRLLLREWFVRWHDSARARRTPLGSPQHTYWRLFGPGGARWRTKETALSVLRSHLRYRRVKKVKTFGLLDYPMRVLLREAPDGLIVRLLGEARRRGVKLNDVFLAAAAEACDRFVPMQKRRTRRELAVASIVDLRPHAGVNLADAFGLFLGFTEVFCRPSEVRRFPKLLDSIAAQSRAHRRESIAQSSLGWLGFAMAVRRFIPLERLYHFYRKEAPLAAGVSNVNLNRTWAADYHPAPLLEYLRVSPTGPMVPLVFTVTTLGPRLHLSLTYRPALVTEDVAAAIAKMFLERLAELVNGH